MLVEPELVERRNVAHLEDYLEAVRRHRVLVLACLALGILLAVVYTNRRVESYEATARVVVGATPVGALDGRLVAPNLDREAELITSDAILEEANASLGAAGGLGSVSATFQPDSDVVRIVATDEVPQRAARLANAVSEVYVARRVDAQTGFHDQNEATLSEELAAVQARIATTTEQVRAIDVQRQEWLNQAVSPERSDALDSLTADRSALQSGLISDQARTRQLEQDLSTVQRDRITEEPAATVIKAAAPPDAPKGLSNWVYWLSGALLGLLVGVITAFLRERLDQSATAARDVELALGSKVIGAVPKFGWRFSRGRWALVMASDRSTARLNQAREAYRRLRSSIQYLERAADVHAIVITSNGAEEGKSTTAANLAITMAMGGMDVALVSGDLRRPSLETTLDVPNTRGLSDYLSGAIDQPVQMTLDEFAGLTFLPAGPPTANPGELLGSNRFKRLIAGLEETHDIVIIDTSPFGATADAANAATAADGVLMVVDGRRTETTDLLNIRDEFRSTGTSVVGAVLNRDASRSGGFLRRRYGYYSTDAPAVHGSGGSGGSPRDPVTVER